MAYKEYTRLIEESIIVMGRMSDRCKRDNVQVSDCPRQLQTVLVRLYLGRRAKLKDIAARELVTTSNLCASFRKLERDGLVVRTVDEHDRRNTWYSVTKDGAALARRILNNSRNAIENMFAGISPADEAILIESLKNINNILTKMEQNNAHA